MGLSMSHATANHASASSALLNRTLMRQSASP
jgi:hypothetical protein